MASHCIKSCHGCRECCSGCACCLVGVGRQLLLSRESGVLLAIWEINMLFSFARNFSFVTNFQHERRARGAMMQCRENDFGFWFEFGSLFSIFERIFVVFGPHVGLLVEIEFAV